MFVSLPLMYTSYWVANCYGGASALHGVLRGCGILEALCRYVVREQLEIHLNIKIFEKLCSFQTLTANITSGNENNMFCPINFLRGCVDMQPSTSASRPAE
jgi:hypothetical protein